MILVTHRFGPYDIHIAEVSSPYEFLGELLTDEGSSITSWACTELLEVAKRMLNGETFVFEMTGDAHEVRLTPREAMIRSQYRIPEKSLQLPLQSFVDAVQQWILLLKRFERPD